MSILGYKSNTLYVKHGVPQGSVLGPLLFLLYINDLHKAINYSKVYHFADDTNLLNITDSHKKLQKQLNIDLKLLYKWLLANKISLNCAKTELKRANGMLSKIRHYVPYTELRSIYYAIFSSHMTYGCQVWGQSITNHTEKVFKLQSRAMRIITFSDLQADPGPLYDTNNILRLDDNIKLQNCLFVHDFLTKNLPESFNGYFQKLDEIYTENTPNTISHELGCLFTPYKSTARYGLCSITRKCIDSWNFFTKKLKTDLSKLSRSNLKTKILRYYNCDNNKNNNNNNINIDNNNDGNNNTNDNNNNNNGINNIQHNQRFN